MFWENKKVLVTGGTSFIGSHLVDLLVKKKARIRIIDNLSSGKLENIQQHLISRKVSFIKGDIRDIGIINEVFRGIEIVFHLAADHGGRGYVDLHQAACASNLMLDGLVFDACLRHKIKKIIYASSGCVYPNYLQTDPGKILYLKEKMVGPPYDADNMYGWAKLMAEMTLKAYYNNYGLKSASCRYFTVYGERGKEDHAVIAMIARAFIKQNPYAVWGTGKQIRNWTYVGDIAEGTILAAEKIEDATAVNLGTMERTRVIDAVNEVLRYTGHRAKIKLQPDMPTGPYNRVADNLLAKKLLGWQPKIKFFEGLHKTIDWYFSVKKEADIRKTLKKSLTER